MLTRHSSCTVYPLIVTESVDLFLEFSDGRRQAAKSISSATPSKLVATSTPQVSTQTEVLSTSDLLGSIDPFRVLLLSVVSSFQVFQNRPTAAFDPGSSSSCAPFTPLRVTLSSTPDCPRRVAIDSVHKATAPSFVDCHFRA